MALEIGKTYEIQSVRYSSVVNLYGAHSGTAINPGNVLTLYSRTGDPDQLWRALAYGDGVKVVSGRNQTFVMNRHSVNNSAIAWPTSTADAKDTEIDFITIDSNQNLYKIKLRRRDLYLTATGPTGTLYWRPAVSGAGTTQQFRLIAAGSTPSGTYGNTIFTGHIRSFAGSGPCLNVYGSETIANNRNVCLWSWSNTNAQTWKVQMYNDSVKIFSMLAHPTYALNIWRGAANMNNCDVYPHAANDTDSHVLLTGTGVPNLYYIRLKNYGLYLTAAGKSNNSNVSWQPWTNGDEQRWLFTTTAPPTPEEPDPVVPENPGEGDSPLVTTFIPAHISNYYDNGRSSPISEITIHHSAGVDTVNDLGRLFGGILTDPRSSNYGVYENQVGQFVWERDASGCNGGTDVGKAANHRAVTIETCNSTEGPDWLVSDTTLNTLIRLVADIAKRNNLGKLVLYDEASWSANGQPADTLRWESTSPPACNLTWHSMYRPTSCPGPYLRSKLKYIRDEANRINGY